MSRVLMDKKSIEQTLLRLAHEIAEATPTGSPLGIIGIRRRGETLAERLIPMVREAGVEDIRHGALDITLYRDDLTTIGPNANVRKTEIDFDVTGMCLVLIDDVLFTGRSVRAALDALTDLGRPQSVRLAVLVDRGMRELPIQPDFVGLRVDTKPGDNVKVLLASVDGEERVELR